MTPDKEARCLILKLTEFFTVTPSLHFERNSRLLRNIEQVIHYRLDQGNAFFAADRFRLALRVAGDERTFGAWRRFGVSEDVNPFVDLFFKLVFVDEAVDLHGAEEMADTAWWSVSFRRNIAIIRYQGVSCEDERRSLEDITTGKAGIGPSLWGEETRPFWFLFSRTSERRERRGYSG